MSKNLDYNLVEVTKSQLDTLISNSQLQLGISYKITDRGDRGITLKAISNNQLSLEGIRNMLCPKSYIVGSLDTNSWKGVWNISKTAVADDLFIWGGLVWKNLTGAIGTSLSEIALDATNWVVIPKASFVNNEYIELIFSVLYDYDADWILEQYDKKGNTFGLSKERYDEYLSALGANPVDITDWNFTDDDVTDRFLSDNKCVGVWNNKEDIKILGNFCTGQISGNRFTASGKIISGNIIGGTYGNIKDNNIGSDISGNYCLSITGNTNTSSIDANYVTGPIANNSNTSYIRANSGCDSISNNSNGGRIAWNVTTGGSIVSNTNGGSIETNFANNINSNANTGQIISNKNMSDISSNTSAVTTISNNGNTGSISSNSITGAISSNKNNGAISSNTGIGNITSNINNGFITSNTLGGFNITVNINNGDITGATLIADISDAIVNK